MKSEAGVKETTAFAIRGARRRGDSGFFGTPFDGFSLGLNCPGGLTLAPIVCLK